MARVWLLPVALGLMAGAACGNKSSTGEACDLLPGDLVISEVMANPLGAYDTGHEWFEIYNASSSAQVLDRLVLMRMSLVVDEATGQEVVDSTAHVVRGAGTVAAGGYFVFGDGVGATSTQTVDYSYDNGTETFGALTNTDGGIGLRCRDRVIDEIWYSDVASSGLPAVEEGRSMSVDGGVTPDALRNDGAELWCSGGATYDGANLGTPGAENIACGFGACDEGGGVIRDVVRPVAGDLIVSEAFGAVVGADAGKEWIEVYVTSSTPVDLNGLTILNTASSTRAAQVTDLACVRGNPGDYLVIGGSDDAAVNGNLAVDTVASGINLFDGGGTFQLRRGLTVIDTAEVPAYAEGVSMSLSSLDLTVTGNDDAANFCNSKTTGEFDGIGSPGLPNQPCCPWCNDGGTYRRVDPPTAGRLVITEVYPDPSGTDGGRDWFEVYVTPGAAVDLACVAIENEASTLRSWTTDNADCSTISGGYAVIGGAEASVDGVTVNAAFAADQSTLLFGSAARLSIYSGTTTIDTINYEDPGSGVSWSLHPGIAEGVNPEIANDVTGNWCVSTETVVFSGTGTPGQVNTTACF